MQLVRAEEEEKARKDAEASAEKIQKMFTQATGLRLVFESQAMLSGSRLGGDERAILQSLAAYRVVPNPETEGALLDVLTSCEQPPNGEAPQLTQIWKSFVQTQVGSTSPYRWSNASGHG